MRIAACTEIAKAVILLFIRYQTKYLIMVFPGKMSVRWCLRILSEVDMMGDAGIMTDGLIILMVLFEIEIHR